MSEIEKMYENADCKKVFHCSECNSPCDDDICKFNIESGFAFFTAEKQIELIKWLARNEMLCRLEDEYPYFERFEECIAYIINYLWQSLTEEEKQQIKEILK